MYQWHAITCAYNVNITVVKCMNDMNIESIDTHFIYCIDFMRGLDIPITSDIQPSW